MSVPVTNANSRVFLIEGGARIDHSYDYRGWARAGSHSEDFGDIERIEVPDPNRYGEYIEVGQIKGAKGRPTNTITSRYQLNVKSTLYELARRGCQVDVQLHFGRCQDAEDFEAFEKVLVYEGAYLTNYNTDELGSLESGENTEVNESTDISAKEAYEVMPLTFAQKAADIVTNEVVDMAICDFASCGDCEDESSGCNKIYAITKAAGGSASTPADLVYSLDEGETWYAHDIDSLQAAEEPDAIDCVGDYLVVVSNDSDSLHYVDKSTVTATADHTWTEMTTGFNSNGSPNAIAGYSSRAFIVGDMGYIYYSDDITTGVTIADAGVATISQLNAVAALSKEFAIAVGNDGTVVKTETGTIWSVLSTPPVGAGVNLNDIAIIDEDNWLIVASDGKLYWTIDAGATWSSKEFSGVTAIQAISFSNATVGRFVGIAAGPAARIYETINGGYSWKRLPRQTGSVPAADQFNTIQSCADDVNVVYTGGLADDGSDGIIVIGKG